MLIFIIGTARSGTCWLGRIIASHPEVTGTIEDEPQFNMVTEAAIYPETRYKIMPKLIHLYQEKEKRHKIYLDKSHPALWLAEELATILPQSRFIIIERQCEDVVASMLKHDTVRERCEKFIEYPEPCPFLGMTTHQAYSKLTIEERCRARWRSHQEETWRLDKLLGKRIRKIYYEVLKADPMPVLYHVQRWLGLIKPFPKGVQ